MSKKIRSVQDKIGIVMEHINTNKDAHTSRLMDPGGADGQQKARPARRLSGFGAAARYCGSKMSKFGGALYASCTAKDRIRVAFIYKPSWRYYDRNNSINNRYYFFFQALRRNRNLQMGYFPAEHTFDTAKLRGKYDVILCTNSEISTPQLNGARDLGIPVIAHTHDPHHIKTFDLVGFHEKYGVDYYFNFIPASYFYKYLPRDFGYRMITYGVEPDLPHLPAFADRIRDRILLTGTLWKGNANDPVQNPYTLRRTCRDLPYVDYAGVVPGTIQYVHAGHPDFITHLSRYRATITATRYFPTIKYYESTAAGCLTFMEFSEESHGGYLGFRDGESAVFIDSKNYKKRFEEYLASPDDPKWAQIAARGKRHTMENLTNDKAAESLVDLMRELI